MKGNDAGVAPPPRVPHGRSIRSSCIVRSCLMPRGESRVSRLPSNDTPKIFAADRIAGRVMVGLFWRTGPVLQLTCCLANQRQEETKDRETRAAKVRLKHPSLSRRVKMITCWIQ